MEDASKYPDINKTVDYLFRNEAGKMVVVLTRIFELANIEQAGQTTKTWLTLKK